MKKGFCIGLAIGFFLSGLVLKGVKKATGLEQKEKERERSIKEAEDRLRSDINMLMMTGASREVFNTNAKEIRKV